MITRRNVSRETRTNVAISFRLQTIRESTRRSFAYNEAACRVAAALGGLRLEVVVAAVVVDSAVKCLTRDLRMIEPRLVGRR